MLKHWAYSNPYLTTRKRSRGSEKHLKRLVRHQIESYNDFVNNQIKKTINMFNSVSIKSELDYDKDVKKYKVEMELNSIEAIKNAVQSSLGAAFVSVSAITKELELNLLNCVRIEDVKINRKLCIILNPNRYKSKASENFTKEILTLLK